jgi:hypothetical protein
MALTVGTGPFGERSNGAFNFDTGARNRVVFATLKEGAAINPRTPA